MYVREAVVSLFLQAADNNMSIQLSKYLWLLIIQHIALASFYIETRAAPSDFIAFESDLKRFYTTTAYPKRSISIPVYTGLEA